MKTSEPDQSNSPQMQALISKKRHASTTDPTSGYNDTLRWGRRNNKAINEVSRRRVGRAVDENGDEEVHKTTASCMPTSAL